MDVILHCRHATVRHLGVSDTAVKVILLVTLSDDERFGCFAECDATHYIKLPIIDEVTPVPINEWHQPVAGQRTLAGEFVQVTASGHARSVQITDQDRIDRPDDVSNPTYSTCCPSGCPGSGHYRPICLLKGFSEAARN